MTLFAFVSSKLGYCAKCVRKAFVIAAAFWVLAIAALFCGTTAALATTLTFAIALTALWLAHIVAYSKRSSAPERTNLARRAFWGGFAKTLAAVALASAMPRTALADSACGGFSGECNRCQRKVSPSSRCEDCHSCGADCPQDNSC